MHSSLFLIFNFQATFRFHRKLVTVRRMRLFPWQPDGVVTSHRGVLKIRMALSGKKKAS